MSSQVYELKGSFSAIQQIARLLTLAGRRFVGNPGFLLVSLIVPDDQCILRGPVKELGLHARKHKLY